MTLRLGALFAIMVLTGCTIDIGQGSQFAGQRCFQETDCVEGLICHERVCTPQVGSSGSGDNNATDGPDFGNNSFNGQNSGVVDGGPPTLDVAQSDSGEGCVLGHRRCVSDLTYEICIGVGEGTEYRRSQCASGEICDEGRCIEIEPSCQDGEYCASGCDTDGEFCNSDCECQPFNPSLCEFQNQPCDEEGQFVNGYYCVSFDGQSQPRCWGVCSVNAQDPDATCPDPNSVCAFGADEENGLCMTTCSTDPATGQSTGCGAEDLGCLSIDVSLGDGICAPINDDNELNDRCDPNNFFDCDEGLVCINSGGGPTGRCRESCRPFAWSGMGTDCEAGHCLPFSDDFGICADDNMSSDGESCTPQFTACGEDAVACYPSGGVGSNECSRLCRLAEGDLDCPDPASNCIQYDPQQDELGVCN